MEINVRKDQYKHSAFYPVDKLLKLKSDNKLRTNMGLNESSQWATKAKVFKKLVVYFL